MLTDLLTRRFMAIQIIARCWAIRARCFEYILWLISLLTLVDQSHLPNFLINLILNVVNTHI